MIAALPTGWRGRVLALGLLGLVLTTAYALLAAPLLEMYAERAALADTQRLRVSKLKVIAAELPGLRARLAELRSAAENNQTTLEGRSDAIASAALQGQIEQFARAADVTIGSIESLPARAGDNYHLIGVRLVLSGPYESLLKLLASLEAATPPLIVDNLQIRSIQRRLQPATAAALDASMEVLGLRSGGATDIAKQ